jgi:hypothetical protein
MRIAPFRAILRFGDSLLGNLRNLLLIMIKEDPVLAGCSSVSVSIFSNLGKVANKNDRNDARELALRCCATL